MLEKEYNRRVKPRQRLISIRGALYNSKRAIKEKLDRMENNGWIPVSERLPEDMEEVLVWFEYFRYGEFNRLYQTSGISYTFGGEWSGFVNGSSGWAQLKIIAWQPLPEPWKGVNR